MIQFLTTSIPNQQCLVTQRSDLPVVDFGTYTTSLDQRVVISVPALEEAAEVLGWVTKDHADDLKDQIAALQSQVQQLEEEATQFDSVIQAIDVIESHDHFRRAQRKRGPQKKQKEEVPVG